MLPILHLNGYKIANPTVLARIPREELEELFVGYGYKPHFVEGDDPAPMHQLMAATLDAVLDGDRTRSRRAARERRRRDRPRWPMIILRSPEGLDRAEEGGRPQDRRLPGASHQVPFGDMDKPEHVKLLEDWMRSYRPEELFDDDGRAAARDRGARAEGDAAHERQPARQWRSAAARPRTAGFRRLRGRRRRIRAASTPRRRGSWARSCAT